MPYQKDIGCNANPDVIVLTVSMVLNPKQGVSVIILEELPEILLVRFRLTGKLMPRAGRFRVDLVSPIDGYPLLNLKEEGQLVHALNAAAVAQASIPVTAVHRPMIQSDGAQELPRRKLRLTRGSA